ncbi:hypothetical protein FA95DRAFT_1504561, partial [Auriscalpium vulgare]
LNEWVEKRDVFLDETIRHNGRCDWRHTELCGSCTLAPRPAAIRCVDCLGSALVCEDCTLRTHSHQPCHRIQRWNGHFFEHCSLSELGLCIQLGHDSLSCPNPRATTTALTVIDVSGVHTIRVRFCDCGNVQTAHSYVQLLRMRWWPATLVRPRTVVTFRACELFHALNIQGKVNAYDFWLGISRVTDGSGLTRVKDHYKDFVRVMRCYRNIRMGKRGGRGHDPAGMAATEVGELVVDCPACPQPGRNLPDGWKDAPRSEQWKYATFLAVDANFKLKLKARGLDDVELAPGWSYFVENKAYQRHIDKYVDEEEMKHCASSFAAVDHANMPTHKRFAVNGVGAVICARHCFYRRSGVGDLQKGERYCNMDYMVLASLAKTASEYKSIVISYDIACQFSINFARRMLQYPEDIRINWDDICVSFLVPKFHLLAHDTECRSKFDFNNEEGSGRTCGEGIESGWADTNGLALSTREMSPASRREALDNLFGSINWRKTVGLGKLLAKNLHEAVLALKTHTDILESANLNIPADIREQWVADVVAWDGDRSRRNPYKEEVVVTTLADIRLELAREEAADMQRGVVSLHQMSASVFLSVGLDIEDHQRTLRVSAKNDESKTPAGKAALQQKRNALMYRITNWRVIQQIYMPAVAALAAAAAVQTITAPSPTAPLAELLWLPTAVPRALWAVGLTNGLIAKNVRLRIAQAEDALHGLRRQLRLRMGMIHYKKVFVDGPGQVANTRARGQISRLKERIDKYAEQYRAAYDALCVLDPEGDWRLRLLKLKSEDVVGPRPEVEKHEKPKPGEGHREIPWIWRTISHVAQDLPGADTEITEDEVHESELRHWVRARARVRRWDEEVQHLLQEMPRSVRFLLWKSDWWAQRVSMRTEVPEDIRDGLVAYASRHCAVYEGLATSFQGVWTKVLSAHDLSVDWPVRSVRPGAEALAAMATASIIDVVADSDSESEASDHESEVDESEGDVDAAAP